LVQVGPGNLAPADFSCYATVPPDPAGPFGYGGVARLTVQLTTLSDFPISNSSGINGTVDVLDADRNGQPSFGIVATLTYAPNLIASIDGFPTNRRVVFRTSGTGLWTTNTYLYVPSNRVVAGSPFTVSADVPIADNSSMNYLSTSSDVPQAAGASVGFGSVFDCGSPPRRVQGVTVSSYVPGVARYTNPTLFKIEPTQKETSLTGRFVLLNVPVTPNNQLLVAYHQGRAIVIPAGGFVARPGVVNVIDLRPPKR
jgi:hypothetical protein